MADRSKSQRRAVMRIDRDRLLKQSEGIKNPLFRYRREGRKRTKVKIVGGEIVGRPSGRATHLGGLQGRLDDPGDASRHLVLQVENVSERTVEAVGPQMRARKRIDQL